MDEEITKDQGRERWDAETGKALTLVAKFEMKFEDKEVQSPHSSRRTVFRR